MSGAVADDGAAYISAGEVFYVGEDLFEPWADPGAGDGYFRSGAALAVFHRDPGNAEGIGVKSVKTELVADEQADQDATGQADGEAENIDEGKGLFPD